MLLLLAIALLGIVALVALVTLVVRPGIERQAVIDRTAVDTRGFERVGWAGAGRYAVIQDFERDGTPIVSAWDRETGKTQVKRGWVWVRTEQAAPAIWLVPITADEVRSLISAPQSYPLAGTDRYDEPAPGLVRWAFDSGSAPAPAALWAPIPNGHGAAAELMVDSAKGSAPSVARFRQPDGSVKLIDATPSGTTLDPVGWSASGQLLAVSALRAPPIRQSTSRETTLQYFTQAGVNTGTTFTNARTGPQCWAGTGGFWVTSLGAPKDLSTPVVAKDLDHFPVQEKRLLEVPFAEGAPRILGPSGDWVIVRTGAPREATEYDEITAPGVRKRVFLVPNDPSATWTAEAWQEKAGLVRLGVSVSAIGETQTRVLLFRPGASRPKTIYKGPKRLTTKGER